MREILVLTCFLLRVSAEKLSDFCVFELPRLDCSQRKIRSLPAVFQTESNDKIREIELSDNFIDSIGKHSFKAFRNLKVIRLSRNNLTDGSIHRESFSGLHRLQAIYLDYNRMTKIQENLVFSRPSSIKKLVLDDNRIARLKSTSFLSFRYLNALSIQHNVIESISNTAFNYLSVTLYTLEINGNLLQSTPKALRKLKKLKRLDIRDNEIRDLGQASFEGLNELKELHIFQYGYANKHKMLFTNTIKVHKKAFQFLPALETLNLLYRDCKLTEFPDLNGTRRIRTVRIGNITDLKVPKNICIQIPYLVEIYVLYSSMEVMPSLSKCSRIKVIDFVGNEIKHIPGDAVSGLNKLTYIKIFESNTGFVSVDHSAFSNMASLIELDLSNIFLKSFLNLTGTTSLKKLNMKDCGFKSIPPDFCHGRHKLTELDLSSNKIKSMPDFSQCSFLQRLDLSGNQISSVTSQLKNLKELRELNLDDNHIHFLGENIFRHCKRLSSIHMAQNLIQEINENTFKDIPDLNILDLSHNRLSKMPWKGLKPIYELKVNDNPDLLQFLTREELPHARQLNLVYPYHCCFFLMRAQTASKRFTIYPRGAISSSFEILDDSWFQEMNYTGDDGEIPSQFIEPLLRKINNDTKLIFDEPERHSSNTKSIKRKPYCKPTPNEFYPCEDLFGKNWLRVCTWIVFLLALLGNVCVLVVLGLNFKKLDVQQYLIINLAFADLCLGVYLGFLAFVDVITLGDFRSHALDWQFSANCQLAGFLAVFASELSVYTLTVITIERFTTIKNSLRIEKQITKKQALIVMVIGWVFSAFIATLPIVKFNDIRINDYTKYSVCLPFETETTASKAYVIILLFINLSAFLLILACYVKIYLLIHGSNAWNSGDSRAARRMAVLVLTDFICWFPIALLSLSVVFRNSLISDLWLSKVLIIFVLPLNACANPFLYAILTKKFHKYVMLVVRKLKTNTLNETENRKSLIARSTPTKLSVTYSTSVRRGSSCSFLFGRRTSTRGEEIKTGSRYLDNLKCQEETERC